MGSISEEARTCLESTKGTWIKREFSLVSGFFSLRSSPDSTCVAQGEMRLFKNFDLIFSSWEHLRNKFAEKEKELCIEDTSNLCTVVTNNLRQQCPYWNNKRLKIVYLVRHAEGTHNVAEREYGTTRWEAEIAKTETFLDANLTPFGIEDAKSKGIASMRGQYSKGMPAIEKVVVSSLTRTLETAQYFFPDEIRENTPFIAAELCRETLGVHTCDKRNALSVTQKRFPWVVFSLPGLEISCEEDKMWCPTHRETVEEQKERVQIFLTQLFDHVPEKNVAIVTHSGFITACLKLLTKDQMEFKPANCEVVPLVIQESWKATT
jgi:broad specificity phosphatase PhoE